MKPKVFNIQFQNDPNAPVDPVAADAGAYRNHILAEGDSWFAWSQIVFKPSSNLLEALDFAEATMVVNCAYTGDVITTMSRFAEDPVFFDEMSGQKYDAILLSGGGNDLIDGLRDIIVPFAGGNAADPVAYVDAGALANLMSVIKGSYQNIIAYRDSPASVAAGNGATPIVLHTYDYPTPRNAPAHAFGFGRVGPWLIKALEHAGIAFNAALYRGISDLIYTRLADTLASLHDPAHHVHVVKTCGTLTRAAFNTSATSGDWLNEIHPTDAGYSKLSALISAQLHTLGLK